ncbi:hypothetical protein TB2_043978 [Malus domestica]
MDKKYTTKLRQRRRKDSSQRWRPHLLDLRHLLEHRQGLRGVLPEICRFALLVKDILVKYDMTLFVADPQRCEPKKFGGHGARARFQKSYR